MIKFTWRGASVQLLVFLPFLAPFLHQGEDKKIVWKKGQLLATTICYFYTKIDIVSRNDRDNGINTGKENMERARFS
jgi:hypothetical protein